MSRIEVIFGGVLVLAVIAAGSFVLFQNGFTLPSIQTGPGDRSAGIAMRAGDREASVFTGDRMTDLCTCYQTGFDRGYENLSVESVAYRGGYRSCRAELGADGGNAWTEGWSNGSDGRLSRRNCRLYLNTLQPQ